MLAEELSDSGSEQLRYQDFFDPPPVAGTPLEGNQLSTYEREKEKVTADWGLQVLHFIPFGRWRSISR